MNEFCRCTSDVEIYCQLVGIWDGKALCKQALDGTLEAGLCYEMQFNAFDVENVLEVSYFDGEKSCAISNKRKNFSVSRFTLGKFHSSFSFFFSQKPLKLDFYHSIRQSNLYTKNLKWKSFSLHPNALQTCTMQIFIS